MNTEKLARAANQHTKRHLLWVVVVMAALVVLPCAPRVLAAGTPQSGAGAGAPGQTVGAKAPSPTPTEGVVTPSPATATPIPAPSRLVITALRTYYDGRYSRALFTHHLFGYYLAYRVGGPVPSGPAWVRFSVEAHGATIFQDRVRIFSHGEGTVSVHASGTLPPGMKTLVGELQMGTDQTVARRSFMVLDPARFLIKDRPFAGTQVKHGVARVESDAQLAKEPYVVRLGARPLDELGRQDGTFQVDKLVWPRLDPGQVAVQATLVSLFGTRTKAVSAYLDQVKKYQACGGTCTLPIGNLQAKGKPGEFRSAYVTKKAYAVHVQEFIFVRGHILIQVWTYTAGSLPSRVSHALTAATNTTVHALDKAAKAQENG